MLKEEVEVCPFCGKEITKKWDVEKNGYQVTCPECGKKIMLCDACLHSEDNEAMRCNWSEENGCFRHPKEKTNLQEKKIMDKRMQNIYENIKKHKLTPDSVFMFHCTMCGDCCRNREDILLNPKDLFNLAKGLNLAPQDVVEKYCEYYLGSSSRVPIVRLKSEGFDKHCVFLRENRCDVQTFKPTVCGMFPIGRFVEYGKDKSDVINYLFNNPNCGDKREIHTVREWLAGYGIPENDEFFIKWTNTLNKHLLKAIDMQERYGGMVVCILNAETIRNPHSNVRKVLKQKLDKYEAKIKFYNGMFATYDTERKTDVEVAVIAIQIPMPEEFSQSFVFDRLDKAKAEELFGFDGEAESKEIVPEGLDFLDSYIRDYNDEVKAGIAILKEYSAYASVRKMRFGHIDSEHDVEILLLKVNGEDTDKNSLNSYIEAVRLRYWKSLFINPRFVGKLTNKMQSELYSSVNEMKYYDFTLHNILELMTQLRDNTLKGIEDSLMTLFDTFTTKYSYIDEISSNIHYYNGWKTNKAHKVNKRVIIPMYGVWSNWRYDGSNHWSLSQYEAISTLRDLAKALDYIADPVYSSIDTHLNLENQIKINFDMGNATNIETKYFILTFYKKGTCHIVFKDDELLEKFNLYVGRQRDWLPPCYGRKAYKDLDEEERAVADSFSGGEEGYNKIYENPTKYLVDSSHMLLLAEGTSV